jgi:hypothetical protein
VTISTGDRKAEAAVGAPVIDGEQRKRFMEA